MTIQWTDAAIEAADRAYHQNLGIEDSFEFWRTVLDAAVAAQGMTAGWINRAVDDAYQEGRADAMEEAANVCEGDFDSEMQAYGKAFAATIRALMEKKG